MIRKIQLINAPNEIQVHKSGSASFYPNLGILSIATSINKFFPEIAVEVIDGSITSYEEIVSRLSADIVGISVLTPTYKTGLEIAKKAKSNGSLTLLGNDHATNLFQNILFNRSYIDFIVCGDHGEIPFLCLIAYLNGECSINDVPNLAYLDAHNQKIKVNKRDNFKSNQISKFLDPSSIQFDANGFIKYSLSSVPYPDRNLIEKQEVYFKNYEESYGVFHSNEVQQTTINLARGCGWGESDDRRCTFCDIYDLSMRTVNYLKGWEEIASLLDLGYNFLYEVCDSFSSFARGEDSFVTNFLKSKPSNIDMPEWFVYSRASELCKPGVIERLKNFNVKRVNIGIDSADDNVLRGMSKGSSSKMNYKAVELCEKNEIQMYISFVFGSIGETKESLNNTFNFISEVSTSAHVVSIDPSVLLPLPNSPSWRYLMNPSVGNIVAKKVNFNPIYKEDFNAKYKKIDLLPTDQLALDWVETFCNCGYDDIIEVRDELLKLNNTDSFVYGGFGVRGF